jgi:hypothetical protein
VVLHAPEPTARGRAARLGPARCCSSAAPAAAVLGSYADRRGGSPTETLALAADLWALPELASRVGDNRVADQALAKVRTLA